MVRHGTQKKRRSGAKVTRKAPKHRAVKIANSVANTSVKKVYDKSKTPSQNLTSFGLIADVNNLKGNADSLIPFSKHAAFVGFGQVMESDTFADKNPKRRKISDVDMEYAAANISKHGNNYKAMEMDVKCNVKQLTEGQMKKLCTLYEAEKTK